MDGMPSFPIDMVIPEKLVNPTTKIFIATLFCLIILSGCMGIGYVATVQDTYRCFAIQEEQRSIRGADCKAKPTSVTKTEILSKLGDPDNMWQQGDFTVWEYERETAMRGVLIQAVVPIPLMIPWGSRTDQFFLDENNQVVKAESNDGELKGGFCGFLVVGHFVPGFGCTRDYQCSAEEQQRQNPHSESDSIDLCQARIGTW